MKLQIKEILEPALARQYESADTPYERLCLQGLRARCRMLFSPIVQYQHSATCVHRATPAVKIQRKDVEFQQHILQVVPWRICQRNWPAVGGEDLGKRRHSCGGQRD
jgi:hypothetical protein